MPEPSLDETAVFLALADPTRRAVFHAIAAEPKGITVTAVSDLVGQPSVNVSHHLGVLRKAGLLESRRDGIFQSYRVTAAVKRTREGWSIRVGVYQVEMRPG